MITQQEFDGQRMNGGASMGIIRERLLQVASVLAAGMVMAACKGTPQPPAPAAPFSDASLSPREGRMQPRICQGDAKGKKFSVAGYPRWGEGLVAGPDPLGSGKVAFLSLLPTPDADGRESVSFRMPIGSGSDTIKEPEVQNATTKTKGVGRGARSETTGTVSDDSIEIHLAGGGTATSKTKLRVSLEVEGGNGSCNLVYVSAIEEK
jgi:hypothetical protein